MKVDQIFLEYALVVTLFFLLFLVQLLQKMVKKQITEQMEVMIPIKAMRDRIAIKIKWKR